MWLVSSPELFAGTKKPNGSYCFCKFTKRVNKLLSFQWQMATGVERCTIVRSVIKKQPYFICRIINSTEIIALMALFRKVDTSVSHLPFCQLNWLCKVWRCHSAPLLTSLNDIVITALETVEHSLGALSSKWKTVQFRQRRLKRVAGSRWMSGG